MFNSLFKVQLQPSSLPVLSHKNCSIWLMNEENIKKCWVINTCLMMGGSTLCGLEKLSPLCKLGNRNKTLEPNKKKLLFLSFNTRNVGGQTQQSERGVTSFLSQYMATFHCLWHAYQSSQELILLQSPIQDRAYMLRSTTIRFLGARGAEKRTNISDRVYPTRLQNFHYTMAITLFHLRCRHLYIAR